MTDQLEGSLSLDDFHFLSGCRRGEGGGEERKKGTYCHNLMKHGQIQGENKGYT